MRLPINIAKLNLAQKGVLLICAPFLVQIVFFLYSGRLLIKAETLAAYEYKSKSIIGHTNWIVILASLSTNGLIGYALTHRPIYLTIYKNCSSEMPNALNGLREAVLMPGNKDMSDCQGFNVAALNIMQSLHEAEK